MYMTHGKKYSGDIGRLLKNTRWFALHFWSTRKRSQHSQAYFTWIARKCEPWSM